MNRASPARRMRAFAYTLVTTALMLALALAEWATERFLAEHSREASTAIEVTIVLVAALVFRPVHKRLEQVLESTMYRRKHHALAAISRFRTQLSSFNDLAQLLGRVIESVQHHHEAEACAVYLRRGSFHRDESSFDDAPDDVPIDDPLVLRMASNPSVARPKALGSRAPGTHAFPMIVGGEVIGFICVHARHGEYDDDELQMMLGLAHDLALASVALDPRVRPKHTVPNNLPADVDPIVGREQDILDIERAMQGARIITLTGPGGVGKTRVALACAHHVLIEHEQGAWFIDLAPVSDPELVASTILAELSVSPGDDPLKALVDYLAPRNTLLVLDNCEHLIASVSHIASQVATRCPGVTILATSRELLRVDGEHVYRLGPLTTSTAVELFVTRASAISKTFRADDSLDAISSICERLDGMPLAIELAAARTRAISVDEIVTHLDERFRLLTSSSREGSARHHTLSATIAWSFDLLDREEQSLFIRLGAFRGSFSLSAAAAVCAQEGRCDEIHVLDVLTSLSDKSLLSVALVPAARYRLLETIREFISEKAIETQAVAIVARQHAEYFASLAAGAYHQFDTRLPDGWLDTLVPDLDNFRAALEYMLCGPGDRHAGAQLAANCGPFFLRLGFLNEGLAWCNIARNTEQLAPEVRGRLEYVTSMLHNNLGEHHRALSAAKLAVEAYRRADDERGLVRALSQVAQLLAATGEYEEARPFAQEAIELAPKLSEPRVYASVLRRCASSLPPAEINEARELYQAAIDVAREARESEEVSLSLHWWSAAEATVGAYERAAELAAQALPQATPSVRLHLEASIAEWSVITGDLDTTAAHARAAFDLAITMQNPLMQIHAIAFSAAAQARHDAEAATLLFGYAKARMKALEWNPEPDDMLAWDRAASAIRDRLPSARYTELLADGALLDDAQATRLMHDDLLNTPSEALLSAGVRS